LVSLHARGLDGIIANWRDMAYNNRERVSLQKIKQHPGG
jgi:hypothetical protein